MVVIVEWNRSINDNKFINNEKCLCVIDDSTDENVHKNIKL